MPAFFKMLVLSQCGFLMYVCFLNICPVLFVTQFNISNFSLIFSILAKFASSPSKRNSAIICFKDLRGKDKRKKSLKSVSAKAVALIGMSSTWLHYNCSQFQFSKKKNPFPNSFSSYLYCTTTVLSSSIAKKKKHSQTHLVPICTQNSN